MATLLGGPRPAGVTGPALDLALDDAHVAAAPPEARGLRRDEVRLMVVPGGGAPRHTRFARLADHLEAGDVVVVNTSATVPAAIDGVLSDGRPLVVHRSTELPGGLWMVEPRRRVAGGATVPLRLEPGAHEVVLSGGTAVHLLRPVPGSQRLWLAVVDDGVDLTAAFERAGRPIRYPYVSRDWPIDAYRTVFSTEPGSSEMPSASRPFTAEVVTALVRAGIAVVPLVLHTGVSSLEGDELPYPERYRVPAATAAVLNAARGAGGHVVAVGTTVVRALESVTDDAGVVHPGHGWTDLVITPERGVRAVDGLVTGWHEPGATHLAMLEAVAGPDAMVAAYREAFATGYLWHEFGDSCLLVPYAGAP